jgi:hypothetical protein
MSERCGERIDTTLGDLISAVSDASIELCEDKRVAYLLAGIALEAILKNATYQSIEIAEMLDGGFPERIRFH